MFFSHQTASQSRGRRGVYFQHLAEENSVTEKRKRNSGNELWTGRRISHKRFVKKINAGTF